MPVATPGIGKKPQLQATARHRLVIPLHRPWMNRLTQRPIRDRHFCFLGCDWLMLSGEVRLRRAALRAVNYPSAMMSVKALHDGDHHRWCYRRTLKNLHQDLSDYSTDSVDASHTEATAMSRENVVCLFCYNTMLQEREMPTRVPPEARDMVPRISQLEFCRLFLGPGVTWGRSCCLGPPDLIAA
uniref:Uncharacterized protein n=1 Tax=Branchiostoma floridae TaxID=7739 RepID=C3Y1Z8_BRAFL|eukprot:XP_002609878.1 hypothetical protein BRAFLDRAFT_90739 [Branchiostoma floridae]